MAEHSITITAAPADETSDRTTLDVTWDLGTRAGLSLVALAGEGRPHIVTAAPVARDNGALGVIDLNAGQGAATLELSSNPGTASTATTVTLFVCDDTVPIGRLPIDLQQTGSVTWSPETQPEAAVPDGTLIVARRPAAASPQYDLVFAKHGLPLDRRFVYLGVLRYRLATSDPGSSRLLRQILDAYGTRNHNNTDQAFFDGLGNELWDLLPQAFRDRFWAADGLGRLRPSVPSDAAPALLLASDDLRFPWELVTPAPRSAALDPDPDLRMLGKRAAIGRWTLGARPPVRMSLAKITAWNSNFSGIGGTDGNAENGLVETFATKLGLGAVFAKFSRQHTLAQMEEMLLDNRQGLLHVRTHGLPDALFLGTNARLTPADLKRLLTGGVTQPPFPRFLFVNACSTGGAQGTSPADPGNESLAEVLVQGGSGGIVLTYWTINLSFCIDAAEAFYSTLGDGESPAEAVRRIREQSVRNGKVKHGSTPLSYTVWGHPKARIVAPPL